MAAEKNYRNWALTAGIVAMTLTVAGLAFWWWKSREYVTTDDARIKAEIVSISSEIQGKIEALTKEEGDVVSHGEIIGRLDNREAEIQLQQAQAELDGARSRREQAQSEVTYHTERHKGELPQAKAALAGHRHNLEDAQALTEKTTADWKRTKSLFEGNLISAQELAHADTAMRQAQAKLDALREKIKEGEVSLFLLGGLVSHSENIRVKNASSEGMLPGSCGATFRNRSRSSLTSA